MHKTGSKCWKSCISRGAVLNRDGRALMFKHPGFLTPCLGQSWSTFSTLSQDLPARLSPGAHTTPCLIMSPSLSTFHSLTPFPIPYRRFLGSPPKSTTCTQIPMSRTVWGETRPKTLYTCKARHLVWFCCFVNKEALYISWHTAFFGGFHSCQNCLPAIPTGVWSTTGKGVHDSEPGPNSPPFWGLVRKWKQTEDLLQYPEAP